MKYIILFLFRSKSTRHEYALCRQTDLTHHRGIGDAPKSWRRRCDDQYADDTQLFISFSPASFPTSIAHLLSVVNHIIYLNGCYSTYSASTLPKQNLS